MDWIEDHLVVTLLLVLLGPMAVGASVYYYASCHKASVYNRINATDFTCGDFFWASEQINSNTQTLQIKEK